LKEPRTRQATLWHQDLPFYNIVGKQSVSFWIPVDPVPKESTLRLVAGSHAGVWYMPRTFLKKEAKWFSEGTLVDVPDVEDGNHEILEWALEPGDAIAFNMMTIHGSRGSEERRRAFSVRVMGDDVRHAPRPWRTSPPFPGLEEELEAGASMEHPLFPLLPLLGRNCTKQALEQR
jgi:ectoine hydroxylase-related dioxygenase (phytanoyl-CoA dioxygenase family)